MGKEKEESLRQFLLLTRLTVNFELESPQHQHLVLLTVRLLLCGPFFLVTERDVECRTPHSLTHTHSLTLSHSLTHSLSHSLSLSLSLSLTLSLSLSLTLSLSLSLTHTHTHSLSLTHTHSLESTSHSTPPSHANTSCR